MIKSITHCIAYQLKLKVNGSKSAVARPQEWKFLVFGFTAGPDVKRITAQKTLERFKRRIQEITRRAKGVSIETTIKELASIRGARSAISASAKRPKCTSLAGSGCDSGPLYGGNGRHHVVVVRR